MPYPPGADDGSSYSLLSLSAGALNADLVPSMNVSQWKWISLYVGTDAFVGTLMPQISFNPSDASSWKNIKMYPVTTLDANDIGDYGITTINIALGAPVIAPYFRVRMTSYTSGSATGVLQVSKDGLPGFQLIASYSSLRTTQSKIGLINNDGWQTTAIAAGVTGNTVVSNASGMLSRIIVTATGTNKMNVYDNASAASGTVIGIVPANQAVDGKPFDLRMPTSNGITVQGNVNNPGVTVSWY